jgi:hypothetical protein
MADAPPPPLAIDLTWHAPRAPAEPATMSALPDALRPYVLGLYSDLARHVDLARPAHSDYDAVRQPGIGIPVLLGRPLVEVVAELAGAPMVVGVAELAEAPAVDAVQRVVVMLLDGGAFDEIATLRAPVRQLVELASRHRSRLLLLPVVLDPRWESEFAATAPIRLAHLPPAEQLSHTRISVAIHLARWLMQTAGQATAPHLRVFISHAKGDLARTDGLASRLNEYLTSHQLATFFDAHDIARGSDIVRALEDGQRDAVLLSVRTDRYGESAWCTEEILTAKRSGVPCVTVWAVADGERRANPYAGNGPVLVWRPGGEAEVLAACVHAWLHHLYFRRRAQRVLDLADVARTRVVLSRAPEVSDLAQGALPLEGDCVVFYPDPPIATVEAQVLRRAQPRLRLTTPSTLVAGTILRDDPAPPLAGHLVAMSMSDSPDAPPPESGANRRGYSALHLTDAVARLTLAVIRAGARVGYGGHLGPEGFTPFLADTIAAHNRLGIEHAELPRLYVPDHRFAQPHSLPIEKWRCGEALREGADTAGVQALQLTAMRETMAHQCLARIALGGRVGDYQGRFPGLLEECATMLAAGKAIYVLGGYGGGADLVVDALLGRTPAGGWPDEDVRSAREPAWAALRSGYDADQRRSPAAAPSLAALIAAIADRGALLRGDDEHALWSNGLTVGENHQLFTTRDLDLACHLIMKGLTAIAAAAPAPGRAERPAPAVRLCHGNLADLDTTEAYAVPVIVGVPSSGAAATLDRRLGGRIGERLRRGGLAPITALANGGANLAGRTTLLVRLELSGGLDALTAACEALAREVARLGIRHLATVPLGASLGLSVVHSLDRLLGAVREHAPQLASVTLCEANTDRYPDLRSAARHEHPVILASPVAAATEADVTPAPVLLALRRDGAELTVTAVAPADHATTTFTSQTVRLPDDLGDRLAAPTDGRGRLLADLLGDRARAVLDAHPDRPIDLLVDAHSADLPWELLTVGPNQQPWRPALEGGLRRCLIVTATASSRIRRIVAGDRLAVLLISDPRRDLAAAATEAASLRDALRHLPVVEVEDLTGEDATADAVKKRLAARRWDVLHYAGHGGWAADRATGSGLLLADRLFTAADLADLPMPPLVVFNACSTSRFTSAPAAATSPIEPAVAGPSLASFVLTAGVQAFVGTSWPVADDAAKRFSTTLYDQLVGGARLDDALLTARRSLQSTSDWGAYTLYGDSALRF